MSISRSENGDVCAVDVRVSADTLRVDLADGRTIAVPLVWYPRLFHALTKERNNWKLIGRGTGIHWAAIDEDIEVEGLLTGKRSGESQKSFAKWMASRPLRKRRPAGTPAGRSAKKINF